MACTFCQKFYTFKPCDGEKNFCEIKSPQSSTMLFTNRVRDKLSKECPCIDCLVKITCKTNKMCQVYYDDVFKPSLDGINMMVVVDIVQRILKT